MEDIPRELERELIAQNRPRPVKKAKNWELILLGDTGEMRPVRHIKGLAILLAAFVLISITGGCWIYYYSRMVVSENNALRSAVTDLKKEEKRLRSEIDSLVSRYMMESVSLEKGKEKGVSNVRKPEKKAAANVRKPEKKAVVNSRKPEKTEPPRKEPAVPKKALSIKNPPPDEGIPPDNKAVQGAPPLKEVAGKREHAEKKTDLFDVAVDDFELSRKRDGNALKVKFIIKNKGRSPQNISGRIFVLLKPDEIEQGNWLISPKAELIDGKPADALLGQFFSINRYKTVRLTLSSDRPTDYYKQCTVFVYNEGGSTILEKEFPL